MSLKDVFYFLNKKHSLVSSESLHAGGGRKTLPVTWVGQDCPVSMFRHVYFCFSLSFQLWEQQQQQQHNNAKGLSKSYVFRPASNYPLTIKISVLDGAKVKFIEVSLMSKIVEPWYFPLGSESLIHITFKLNKCRANLKCEASFPYMTVLKSMTSFKYFLASCRGRCCNLQSGLCFIEKYSHIWEYFSSRKA